MFTHCAVSNIVKQCGQHQDFKSHSVVSIKILRAASQSFSHCLWCFNIQRFPSGASVMSKS